MTYDICPKAKANIPERIQNFLVLVVIYLKPSKTSPNMPKIKPISMITPNCLSPSVRQTVVIPKAMKKSEATVFNMIVTNE